MTTTDATIVVPTFRHPHVLPLSLRSALDQDGTSVELFVVGDGVGDDTRDALKPFLSDARVRFFDLPKGERRGEKHRDTVLREARGEIVCYLSDDDVLFPNHVAEMRRLLRDADFAHPPPVIVLPDGVLRYRPADLSRPEFFDLIRRGQNNFISLTGASHTPAVYRRLPYGWRPAPAGKGTDIHMWEQFWTLPDLRGATGRRLTAIHFPDPDWSRVDPALRVAELERWLALSSAPGGLEALDGMLSAAVLHAAQDFKLRAIESSAELEEAHRQIARLREPGWRRLARRAKRRLAPLRRRAA
jgi:glycosyltransferase involved in cell wall biosynthesis